MKLGSTFTLSLLAAGSWALEIPAPFAAILKAAHHEHPDNLYNLDWSCASCTLAVDSLDAVVRNQKFEAGFESLADLYCRFIESSEKSVCPAMISQFGPSVFDVSVSYLLDKDRICNETFGLCSNPHIQEVPVEDVVKKILATKPSELADDDFINKLYAEIASDPAEREIIRAVHISDVHLDPDYAVGSIVKCGDTLCCRDSFGPPGPDDDVAGEWGANKGPCDLPVKTFESMMEYVVAEQKPDMIFWTGDNSAHTIWNNTVEEVTADTTLVTNIIKEAI